MIDESRFAAILAGAQRGEELAVAVLFADLQPRLLRFLRAQEPTVAEDLASEVWIGIARGIGRFEGDAGAFRAWAFSIARRRIIDHRRRSGPRRADVVVDDERMAREVGPAVDDTAVANLSAEKAVGLIRSCLPPEQAEVVLLRVLGDLDAAQVADVMGRSVSWVRVTQHRALRRLVERAGARLGVSAMSADDDMDDVLHRIEALARADRFLSGSPTGDGSDEDWSEVAPLLDAAQGPAAGDELVGVDTTIDTFTRALRIPSSPATHARKPVLSKLLTGKAIAGIAVASLITAGTAAAATGQFHAKDRGVISTIDASDSSIPPATTIANAESDPSTTTSTSTSTTTTVVPSTTIVTRPAADNHAVGPALNSPAKLGLCTAYLASHDHHGKNLTAPPFHNLLQAAVDAGQTVEDFCADVTATTSTTASPDDQNGNGDHRGHGGNGDKGHAHPGD